MTKRDRAAIDVYLLLRNFELVAKAQHDRGKGLVDLEQVDVVEVQARAIRQLAHGGRRSAEHTSALQSLMHISSAVFCLKTKRKKTRTTHEPLHPLQHFIKKH